MIDESLVNSLAPSPTYRPFLQGRYDVSAGLSAFGKDFGNGTADQNICQFDRAFPRYHAAKLRSLQLAPGAYIARTSQLLDLRQLVANFIIDRLLMESPHLFTRCGEQLICRLTDHWLSLEQQVDLDSICCEIMEDIAIVHIDGNGCDRLDYLHVCLPNRWSPGDKVGRRFTEIHEPVAGIEAVNKRANALSDMMINATSGFVRFAWGITFADQLNLHPEYEDVTPFDPAKPHAFVRVERQTIFGFPSDRAALFTIRTYMLDCKTLAHDDRAALIAAIESMSPASLIYKGLVDCKAELIAWLRSLNSL